MFSELHVDILLVDDRDDNLTVLEAVLDSPGYRLHKARSGYEAIEIAARKEFAAILMDVQMPGIDGFDTAKGIRSGGLSKDAPIVFVTAIYGDDMYVRMGYSAGAVDYIFKPFHPEILRSKVGVFADLYRKTQQLLNQSEKLRQTEQLERSKEIAELRFKNLEKELAVVDAQRRLAAVIQRAPVILASIDREGTFTVCSGAGLELLGVTPAEILGRNLFKMGEKNARIIEMVQKAINGLDVSGEVQIGGRSFDVFLTPEVNQSRGGALAIMRDITDQKHYQLNLKRSEENQRFLAEAGKILARSLDFTVTMSTIIDLVVPQLATWSQIYSVDEAGAMRVDASKHEDSEKGVVLDELNQAHSAMADLPQIICDGITNDVPVLITPDTPWLRERFGHSSKYISAMEKLGMMSLVFVPFSGFRGFKGAISFGSSKRVFDSADIHFFRELTKRAALAVENARLYSEAEMAIKTRDEFLSIASHELRTPLTPLKLQFQTISKVISDGRQMSLTPEVLSKMVVRADRQLDRLSSIIEDLLNVARINTGRLSLVRHSIDLSKLIREVSEQFREQFYYAKCDLYLELDKTIEGYWDPFKLEQVIINLLTNAIKYGSGKPVVIWAKDHGDSVSFGVKDSGIGIAPDDRRRIFELFERAVSPKHYGGLGLGLFIVRNIVESHGGTVVVESEEGNGSQFTVRIPKRSHGEEEIENKYIPDGKNLDAVGSIIH